MRQLLQALILMAGLLFIPLHALASPEVDRMSDIEVSEYAVQMSKVIEEIQCRELCVAQDTSCVRAEFAHHGVSYDDKALLQKRLVLMIGSMH